MKIKKFEVISYQHSMREQWNKFVRAFSVFFQWQRDYLEYHANRFQDASLLVLDKKQEIRAIFPANQNVNAIHSHEGLSFGGILFSIPIHISDLISIGKEILNYYKEKKVQKIYIKPLPWWLTIHQSNLEELLWQQLGAILYKSEFNLMVPLQEPASYQYRRKRMMQKAQKVGVSVSESNDYREFWQILTTNLQRKYQIAPVHSLQEIEKLQSFFPENIKLYVSYLSNQLIGGIVLYDYSPLIAHAQYIASNETGRKYGALDFLVHELIEKYRSHRKFFSLGVNTLRPSDALNWGLVEWKEGFSAKPYVQHQFKINLSEMT
ncbi:MAG: hypothetical protein NZM38_00545 [Cytophagales bacterium]|nr:hypothetical protein [Cytophagales bacterium]MDW8383236.1 hypothetical protein [Flammeovirgaceae bacterium]